MFDGEILDTGGMDVVSAADDQVLLAADDLQVSAFVDRAEVTAHEPALGVERVLARSLIVEVAEHEERASCADFPDFPRLCLQVRILLIPEARFVTGARFAAS